MMGPKKIDWTTYFMAQAFIVSMRSIDPSTKHGAIIADANNRIISTGYNGPIGGIDDKRVPLTRPDKYPHMIHAEENAILSFNGIIPPNSKIYVTGKPCHKCLRMILQKGIRKIVYGPQNSKMFDEEEEKAVQLMLKLTKPNYIEFKDFEGLAKFIEEYYQRMKNIIPE